MTPDGERFLMVTRTSENAAENAGPQIIVVENWLEELKRLVPIDN